MYIVSNIHLRGSELLTVCHVSNVLTASDAMKSDEKSLVHQVEKKYIFDNKGENISATLNLAAFKSLIKTLPRIATCPAWKSLRLTRSSLAPLDSRNQTTSRSLWASWACRPSGSSPTASTSPSPWSPTSCSSVSGRWRRGQLWKRQSWCLNLTRILLRLPRMGGEQPARKIGENSLNNRAKFLKTFWTCGS